MIDQADQAEPFGDRHDVRCEQKPVVVAHAHEALVERGLARGRRHHRLEGDDETAVVQRRDDLVGDADVDAPLRLALDIRQPGHERAGAALFCGLQRFLRAAHHIVGGARIARHVDAADRHGDGDRTRLRRHDLVAQRREKALRRDLHLVDRAVLQDQGRACCRRNGRARRHRAAVRAGALRARE